MADSESAATRQLIADFRRATAHRHLLKRGTPDYVLALEREIGLEREVRSLLKPERERSAVYEDWRAAQRDLIAAPPNSRERMAILAEMERLRLEYTALVEEIQHQRRLSRAVSDRCAESCNELAAIRSGLVGASLHLWNTPY